MIYLLSANLINVTVGFSIAWFIVYANKFRTDENPLEVPPLEHDEVQWLYASFFIGTLIGIILLTLCGDAFGRKSTIVVLLTPQAVIFHLTVRTKSLKFGAKIDVKCLCSSRGL